MSKLQMIAVSDIYPHPQNPRKDLGDLTELTASIKQNGILQNLTLVKRDEGGYTAIIGHRRLAAATAAGLEKVPCVVVKMSDQEQLETMLVENINRSDLTVYEQAEGFQLLLDFGSSIEEIAKTSGFSESTVRRRVKLLELDKEKFRNGVEQGATLDDFAQLDKIKDIELKNKALEKIGTGDFDNVVRKAVQKEKEQAILDKFEEIIKKFAQKIDREDTDKYSFVDSYYSWCGDDTDIEIPSDATTVKYFYTRGDYDIDVYKEKIEVENEEEDKEELERKAQKEQYNVRRNEIQSATAALAEKRKAFIKELIANPNNINECELIDCVSKLLLHDCFRYNSVDMEFIAELKEVGDDVDFIQDILGDNGVLSLLLETASVVEYRMLSFYCEQWNSEKLCYEMEYYISSKVQAWYDFLNACGYSYSDVEEALLKGEYEKYAGWEDIDNENI